MAESVADGERPEDKSAAKIKAWLWTFGWRREMGLMRTNVQGSAERLSWRKMRNFALVSKSCGAGR
jgi:hypothetical protein